MATFTVRGKNIEITPSLREYVEKRVGKVTKYFESVGDIKVLLTVSKGRHIVEVTVPIPGGILLRCAACGRQESGLSLPLCGDSLRALRHILYGDPKRLFSFRLSPGGLEQLSGAAEAYLLTQLERGFRTLDFYKELAAPFAIPTKQE